MQKTILFLLIVILVNAELLYASDRPGAVIINLRGEVLIKKAKEEWKKIKDQTVLKEGMTIKTGRGSEIRLLLATGEIKFLGEMQKYTISKRPKEQDLTKIFKNVHEIFIHEPEGSIFEIGGIRLRGPSGRPREICITLVNPRFTGVTKVHPTFEWTKLDKEVTYEILLEDDKGEIWREKIRENCVSYPMDREGLSCNKMYYWSVRAEREGCDEVFESEYVSFIILSQAVSKRLKEIESELKERLGGNNSDFYIIMGKIYEKEGAYIEAIEHYKKLTKIFPENKEGHRLLSQVYEKIGLYEEAIAELKKAAGGK